MKHLPGIVLAACLLLATLNSNAQSDDYTIHVVQRGENLFRIALNYNLTADQLALINGIENSANIQVGQRLLVPNTAADVAPNTTEHITQPGDTLATIANAYNTTPDAIRAANALPPDATLTVGVSLTIPPSDNPPASAPATTTDTAFLHTVQPGETLFRIAQQYDLTVNDLTTANTLTDPTRIYSGQQLVIPGFSPPQLTSALPAPLNALHLNPQVLTEGKTGYLQIETAQPLTLQATFLDQQLTAVPITDTLYRIFIGIPVFTEPGIYPLTLTTTPQTNPITANVQIIPGPYGSERINLIEGRDNLLNTNVETAESDLLTNVMTRFTPQPYLNGKMSLPAAAAITSGFGTRRSYNGGAFDRFHSGTDFAGVPGTPIFAPAPGIVVLADTLNVRGNATVIDHGWGIYTGYWHQTDIYVSLGDTVEIGQIIGTIGSTGRVTGAHLHWELWVNGVPVDPMQWVQHPFVTIN